MAWTITEDVPEYLAAAGEFLRSRTAEHTVLIIAAEAVRVRGTGAFGEVVPLFGWWQEGAGGPSAAFLHTPPYPVVLTGMAAQVATALAGLLADRGRQLSGANGDNHTAPAFASAWQARTGQPSQVRLRSRLYRLGRLRMPDPAPPGRARVAITADRDLLITWLDAFHRDANPGPGGRTASIADDKLSYGGLTFWEAGGEPVSLAGLTRMVAGQVRVGPVYTPVHLRRRGFGGAATAAVSRAALEAGAQEVVLFTDLANPTSNALYQRLGYCPVSDRVHLAFGSPAPGQRWDPPHRGHPGDCGAGPSG
jgi:RimJ/RimL family protein N-acetyltransferase